MKKRIGKFLVSGCLLSLLIASFIVPSKVDAATTHENDFRVLFSFDNAKGITYVYADFIFTCTGLVSGIAEVTFKYGNINVSYGMNDGEGVIGTDFYVPSTGYRTYQIEYENTSYFVFRFIFRDRAADNVFWDSSRLASPAGSNALDLSFSIYSIYDSTVSPNTANAYPGLEQYTQAKIAAYLYKLTSQGLNIDTSTIEDLLEQIIANQQGNQSTSDSTDQNDDINDDFQGIAGDYEELEQNFIDDFGDNMENIDTTDLTTSLTQLSPPISWLKSQMDMLFDSMGTFKFIPEVVLMIAIALIFIGR